MENINKLIQNTDLSFEMQTNLYDRIEDVSIEIDAHKERYEKCKKDFMAADAKLNKAIAEDDDYAAQFEAAQEIIPIVNALHKTRERINELTITKQSFYKKLMDHQKSDEHTQKSDEHVYVLPRQQVIEFLDAIEEEVDENPDFKTITIAINTSLLKK
jgi:FAD/FMN-containing dehydrogenase